MASSPNKNDDVAYDFFPFVRIYKDGRIQRLQITFDIVSANADNPKICFPIKRCHDLGGSSCVGAYFIPSSTDLNQKLPILLYVHSGGFCIESTFNLQYHNYVGSLAVKANVVAVSVEYRLALEHLLPACYDDCWDALWWVTTHVNRIYKDGRVQRLQITSDIVSADADDPKSAFLSKDVTISADPAVSARIFIPSFADPNQKLPILLYVHGGGFCIESAFNLQYHSYVGSLAVKANVVAVSVEYRLAPEHLFPACYEDCWDALRWVATHVNRDGPEPWLNNHADFNRVCLAGDSAGANICNHLAVRAGSSAEQLGGIKVVAMALIHPFFGDGGDDRLWKYLCSDQTRSARPRTEDLAKLPCGRVKVFLAEEDFLKVGGRNYGEDLKRSRWNGAVETVEHDGEDHVFHLKKPECEKALDLLEKLASFINLD